MTTLADAIAARAKARAAWLTHCHCADCGYEAPSEEHRGWHEENNHRDVEQWWTECTNDHLTEAERSQAALAACADLAAYCAEDLWAKDLVAVIYERIQRRAGGDDA